MLPYIPRIKGLGFEVFLVGGGGDALGEEDADVVDHAGAAVGGVAFFEDHVLVGSIAFIYTHHEVGDCGIEHPGGPEACVLLAAVGIPVGEAIMKHTAVGFSDERRGVLIAVAVVKPVGTAFVVEADTGFK